MWPRAEMMPRTCSSTTIYVAMMAMNVGTIEVGKKANLVLADENPLDDLSTLRTPYGGMVLGRWYDRARLSLVLLP